MSRMSFTPVSAIVILIVLFMTASVGWGATKGSHSPPFRIGFHFYKPGKIYEDAYQGIIDGLKLEGIEFEQVIYRSGRDQEKARANLLKMDTLNLSAIVSFSSAGTRVANSLRLQTPLLASVINHPISLGISAENQDSNSRISGTSYYINASQQLALYLELFPQIQKVGMLYDLNNPAGYLAEEPLMREACVQRELGFYSVGATSRDNLSLATKELLQHGVEIIIIPTNLQIYNNLDLVLELSNQKEIPVVSMNKQGVEAGAIAALYADTYKTGRRMVNIIKQIVLDGQDVQDIPFYYSLGPDLIINLKSAGIIDYEFKPEVLGRASIVLN